jgi:hypothetical protein
VECESPQFFHRFPGVRVILRRQGLCVLFPALLAACAVAAPGARAQRNVPELAAPIEIYAHASVPAAPSAASPLSEALAMHDIDQLARLKKSGLRIDYDLLDASAIAPDGLHASGRTAAWPKGPGAWIAHCRAAGIRPGMRFSSSALRPFDQAPFDFNAEIFRDFIPTLQSWYDRGIRLFAFDGLDLTVATPETAARLSQDEIVAHNREALSVALTAFRAKNRDAVLLAIAGNGSVSDRSPAFLLLSAGSPRGPSWPETSIERADEIETDSEIRRVEQTGVPLAHILSEGFIAARDTLECPAKSCHAPVLARPWKGDFLLSHARGSWVHPLTGDLDAIQAADVRWMARVENLFFELERQGRISSFGGAPAEDFNMAGQPYGFAGATSRGAVYVVVNPGQTVARLSLPALASGQPRGPGRILFRDAGFSPHLTGNDLTLGPGQMAAVGFGAYAAPEFNFGVQREVLIPESIEPVDADFHLTAPGVLEARFDPPIRGVLRIVVLEREPGGKTQTGTAAPPGGTYAPAAGSGNRFTLEITQAGRPIPLRPGGVESEANGTLSAQPSWAVAEIDINDLTPGIPLRVRFQSNGDPQATLEGSAYQVIY